MPIQDNPELYGKVTNDGGLLIKKKIKGVVRQNSSAVINKKIKVWKRRNLKAERGMFQVLLI